MANHVIYVKRPDLLSKFPSQGAKGVQRIITWILRNRSKGQPAATGDDFHRSALLGE